MGKWAILLEIWEPFRSCDASLCTSAACFYWILSALPACSLLLCLPNHFWVGLLLRVTPQVLHPVVLEFLQLLWEKKTVWSISVSGIMTLWSASRGTTALADGLYRVMEQMPPGRFWQRQLRRVLSFLLFLAIILSASGALIVQDWLFQGSPVLQILFSAALLSTVVCLLFRALGKHHAPLRCCMAAGAFVAAGWMLFSWLFSIYVRWFSRQVELYGFLGLGLMAMLWLHSCVFLLLCGGRATVLLAKGNYHPIACLGRFVRKNS